MGIQKIEKLLAYNFHQIKTFQWYKIKFYCLILKQIRLPRLRQALLFRDHAAILLHFFFYQRKINTVFNAEFGLVSHS